MILFGPDGIVTAVVSPGVSVMFIASIPSPVTTAVMPWTGQPIVRVMGGAVTGLLIYTGALARDGRRTAGIAAEELAVNEGGQSHTKNQHLKNSQHRPSRAKTTPLGRQPFDSQAAMPCLHACLKFLSCNSF